MPAASSRRCRTRSRSSRTSPMRSARGPTRSSVSRRSSRPARSWTVAPGETIVIAGGVIAGQGEIELVPLIGHRLDLRGARRHHELLHRPPARPRLPREARAAREDHARAARAGRRLLRPARRQDDPDRPLHRPGAGARAVHRRLVGPGLPALHPVQHRRLRRVGDALLRPRLHLLALVRQGPAPRRPGAVRRLRSSWP